MTQIDYPYHFDNRGHTAETSLADHIRDMIEEILFTSPGERVNRPGGGHPAGGARVAARMAG